MAGEPHLYISALGDRRVRLVAVPVSGCSYRSRWFTCDRGEAMGQAWTAGWLSVSLRNAGAGARVRRRVPVSLFLRRRSFSISCEPRRDRADCEWARDGVRAPSLVEER